MAIKKCRDHLSCVEHLKINQGTSKNENLHRILNSMFKSRTNVSPDFAMKLISMRLWIYNNDLRNIDDPIFMLTTDDSTASFALPSHRHDDTQNELSFPSTSSSDFQRSPTIQPPLQSQTDELLLQPLEVEILKTSFTLYKSVLAHFNEEDLLYRPVDIVFHCPVYTQSIPSP